MTTTPPAAPGGLESLPPPTLEQARSREHVLLTKAEEHADDPDKAAFYVTLASRWGAIADQLMAADADVVEE